MAFLVHLNAFLNYLTNFCFHDYNFQRSGMAFLVHLNAAFDAQIFFLVHLNAAFDAQIFF
jgi:hypothetical protein